MPFGGGLGASTRRMDGIHNPKLPLLPSPAAGRWSPGTQPACPLPPRAAPPAQKPASERSSGARGGRTLLCVPCSLLRAPARLAEVACTPAFTMVLAKHQVDKPCLVHKLASAAPCCAGPPPPPSVPPARQPRQQAAPLQRPRRRPPPQQPARKPAVERAGHRWAARSFRG